MTTENILKALWCGKHGHTDMLQLFRWALSATDAWSLWLCTHCGVLAVHTEPAGDIYWYDAAAILRSVGGGAHGGGYAREAYGDGEEMPFELIAAGDPGEIAAENARVEAMAAEGAKRFDEATQEGKRRFDEMSPPEREAIRKEAEAKEDLPW